jgi:hypothetical protein
MERLRRRLIKLLSAGWIPPSVFRLGASSVSRGRASDRRSGHIATSEVPLRGSIPRPVQDDAAIYRGGALAPTCDPDEALQSFALIMIVGSNSLGSGNHVLTDSP